MHFRLKLNVCSHHSKSPSGYISDERIDVIIKDHNMYSSHPDKGGDHHGYRLINTPKVNNLLKLLEESRFRVLKKVSRQVKLNLLISLKNP